MQKIESDEGRQIPLAGFATYRVVRAFGTEEAKGVIEITFLALTNGDRGYLDDARECIMKETETIVDVVEDCTKEGKAALHAHCKRQFGQSALLVATSLAVRLSIQFGNIPVFLMNSKGDSLTEIRAR